MRITRSDDGVVVADGASDGRGAWLCRSVDGDGDDAAAGLVVERCLEAALSRRAFARAWGRRVDARDELAIDEAAIRESVGRAGGRDARPDAH